ncbi:hypothetical protein GQ457_11G033430 [Hibiscus cannabinus]
MTYNTGLADLQEMLHRLENKCNENPGYMTRILKLSTEQKQELKLLAAKMEVRKRCPGQVQLLDEMSAVTYEGVDVVLNERHAFSTVQEISNVVGIDTVHGRVFYNDNMVDELSHEKSEDVDNLTKVLLENNRTKDFLELPHDKNPMAEGCGDLTKGLSEWSPVQGVMSDPLMMAKEVSSWAAQVFDEKDVRQAKGTSSSNITSNPTLGGFLRACDKQGALFTLDVQFTDYIGSLDHVQSPLASLTEQSSCPLCLERLDQDASGVPTTIGNHSFHCSCISKWTDFSCPVCRYCQQQPEKSKYFICQTYENIWISVICGFVGCGRYEGGYAIIHWKETQPCYSLEPETHRIWDYDGDNYVHHLIQPKTDGKPVELNSHCLHTNDGCGSCHCVDSGINEAMLSCKAEIVNEYNELLRTQLENQKNYFETLLQQDDEKTERAIVDAVNKAVMQKSQKMQAKLERCVKEKNFFMDLNENVLKNQEIWKAKLLEVEREEASRNQQLILVTMFFILEQANKLSRRIKVTSIVLDFSIKTVTTHTLQFLGLLKGATFQRGGFDTAGEGIVIGFIDASIDLIHSKLLVDVSEYSYSIPIHFPSVCEVSMIGQFGVGFYLAYLISEIVIVTTNRNNDEMTSLKDFVTRMDSQNDIYYITDESMMVVENSPFLEKLTEGYEVIYMVDVIDEYVIGQLKEFEGKKLMSTTKKGLKLDESEDEKRMREALKEKFASLCKVIKDVLGDKVEKVVISDYVINSPCCSLIREYGWTAKMGKIMKAHALKDKSMTDPREPMTVFVHPHSLIKHWILILENEQTPCPISRNAMVELERLLMYETSMDWLSTVTREIQSPMVSFTSMPVGDIKEDQILYCFGNNLKLRVNSTQLMIDHLLEVVDVMGVFATIRALPVGWIHPHVNMKNLNEEMDMSIMVASEKRSEKQHSQYITQPLSAWSHMSFENANMEDYSVINYLSSDFDPWGQESSDGGRIVMTLNIGIMNLG